MHTAAQHIKDAAERLSKGEGPCECVCYSFMCARVWFSMLISSLVFLEDESELLPLDLFSTYK